MSEVNVDDRFGISAADLWAAVGDPADVARWIPSLQSARLEGDVRHVVFTDGEPAREKIVHLDDDKRTYTYEYIDGPLPLTKYSSTITVTESGAGSSTLTWSAEFAAESAEIEAGLVTAIDTIYREALTELHTLVEGRPVSR